MTEDQGNSPDAARPADGASANAPTPPQPHSGAQGWEAPQSPSNGNPPPPPASYGPTPGVAGSPPAAPGYAGRTAPGHVNDAPSFRSWQPGIIPLRPLTFGDFLTVPFKAMRYNRAVVLGAPVLFTLASTVLVLITMWMVFTDPQLGLLNAIPSLSGISTTTVAMIAVSLLAVLLADVFSSSVIAPGVARAVMGERITITTAWRQVRRRLGSLLLLYLASSAVLILLIVITLSPMLLTLAGGDPNAGVILLSIALFFVVMLPAGLLVTLFQGVARAAIVLEGISIRAALRRTMRLMRGRFWWSVLILFVSTILINIVSSVLQYMGQFGFMAAVLIAPDNMAVIAISFMVVYGLSYVGSMVIIYSYLGSIFALMYIDMRMRREGFDLDLARAAEERAGR